MNKQIRNLRVLLVVLPLAAFAHAQSVDRVKAPNEEPSSSKSVGAPSLHTSSNGSSTNKLRGNSTDKQSKAPAENVVLTPASDTEKTGTVTKQGVVNFSSSPNGSGKNAVGLNIGGLSSTHPNTSVSREYIEAVTPETKVKIIESEIHKEDSSHVVVADPVAAALVAAALIQLPPTVECAGDACAAFINELKDTKEQ